MQTSTMGKTEDIEILLIVSQSGTAGKKCFPQQIFKWKFSF